jgi:hypothetical protein
MFLTPHYFGLEPVVIAAVVVFLIDLIANTLSFRHQFWMNGPRILSLVRLTNAGGSALVRARG